jgi:hypothetical protein
MSRQTIDDILTEVEEIYRDDGISRDQIFGGSLEREVVKARHHTWYLHYLGTDCFAQTARAFSRLGKRVSSSAVARGIAAHMERSE